MIWIRFSIFRIRFKKSQHKHMAAEHRTSSEVLYPMVIPTRGSKLPIPLIRHWLAVSRMRIHIHNESSGMNVSKIALAMPLANW
jgi:hypothetical protein